MSGDGTLTLDRPGRRIAVRSPDGTRLNVESYGPDDAPTVILVHGWTCCIVFWTKQVDALVAAGLRVVAYDQRGHGASGAPGPAGHSLDALADDLSAVLQVALAPGRKAVVAGHSMGAMTLVAFGARHPRELRARVASAMLASTAMKELVVRNRIVPLPLPLARLARPVISKLMGLSPAGNRTNGWQRFITRYSGLTRSASEADVIFCTTLIGSCPPRTRAAFARTLSRLDLDEQVAEFDVPTIVLGGRLDRLTPIWHARRLAGALPELLEFVEIPDSGHMTPVQSADQVNAVLLRLVREHLPTRVDPSEEMHTGPTNGSIDSTTTAQETA